jgi:hypothetical protein
MKCPYCQKPINILSKEWRTQSKETSTRHCPQCGGVVKLPFSGMISIGVFLATIGLAVSTHSLLPSFPMSLWGMLGAVAIFILGARLVKAYFLA